MQPHEENAPPVHYLADVERKPDHSSKAAEIDGILQMSFDSTSRLNQPSQRAF